MHDPSLCNFFHKIKYLYFCPLQQHMRSGRDLSSRPGIFALLRSQNLVLTIQLFPRPQVEEVVVANPCCNLEEIRVNLARLLAAWSPVWAGTCLPLSKVTSNFRIFHVVPCFCNGQETGPWAVSLFGTLGRPTGSFDSRISWSYRWRLRGNARSTQLVVADTLQLTCSTLAITEAEWAVTQGRGSQLICSHGTSDCCNNTRVSQCLPCVHTQEYLPVVQAAIVVMIPKNCSLACSHRRSLLMCLSTPAPTDDTWACHTVRHSGQATELHRNQR